MARLSSIVRMALLVAVIYALIRTVLALVGLSDEPPRAGLLWAIVAIVAIWMEEEL